VLFYHVALEVHWGSEHDEFLFEAGGLGAGVVGCVEVAFLENGDVEWWNTREREVLTRCS
jgi:hypothetical protein